MLGSGYKILCIGSGGVRGLAFIGALKYVDYSSIKCYYGISIGSVLSMCLSVGYSPSEIEELAIKTEYKNLVKFSAENLFNYKEKLGVMNNSGLRIFLCELLKAKGYSPDCCLKDVPSLGVVVSNLNSNRGELWRQSDDKVVDSVIASTSIPLLFEPYRKGSEYYVDGCLYVDCASELSDDPESCYSLSLESSVDCSFNGSMLKYFERVLNGSRIDRCRRYFEGRKSGSYTRIRLDGLGVMDFDLSVSEKMKIINTFKNDYWKDPMKSTE